MALLLPIEYGIMDRKFKDMGLDNLAPPPQVYQLSWAPDQIFQEVDGKRYRRVFFNIEYEPLQKQQVAEVRKQLAAQQLNDQFTDPVILKNFIAGKQNKNKCLERLRNVYKLHQDESLNKFTADTISGLQKGFIYTFGYDREYCPVVYVRPDLIDFKDQQFLNPVYCLMYVIQRYRMVPYHAQKYVLVIDLNHMNVSDIPFKKLYQIMHNVSVLYTGCIKRVLLLNSSGLGSWWNIFKRFIPERAKRNLTFVKQYPQMNQFIDPSQRQLKYQGLLPDLTAFWPPHSTVQVVMPPITNMHLSRSQMSHQRVSEQVSFYSIENNQEYFYKLQREAHQSPPRRCECKCLLF